jgi:cytoskeletal protein RodZ
MNDQRTTLALSTIRRNRGISLQQIADQTKISLRSLEAIEQGDYRKLPGGIYNTSYIKQYARAIDYDESEILSAYHRAMNAASTPSTGGSKPDRSFGIFRTASGTL